jgi:hypothetical protein
MLVYSLNYDLLLMCYTAKLFWGKCAVDENRAAFNWNETINDLVFLPLCLTTRSSSQGEKKWATRCKGACATINYSIQVNNVFIYESDLRSPYVPFHHQFCYWLAVASTPLDSFCYPIVFIELLYWRATKVHFSFFFSYICETFWRSCCSTYIFLSI